jgi:hypothetical protein
VDFTGEFTAVLKATAAPHSAMPSVLIAGAMIEFVIIFTALLIAARAVAASTAKFRANVRVRGARPEPSPSRGDDGLADPR